MKNDNSDMHTTIKNKQNKTKKKRAHKAGNRFTSAVDLGSAI